MSKNTLIDVFDTYDEKKLTTTPDVAHRVKQIPRSREGEKMKKIGYFKKGNSIKFPYSSEFFLFIPDNAGWIDVYEVKRSEVFPDLDLAIPAFELVHGNPSTDPFGLTIWKHKTRKGVLVSPYYLDGKYSQIFWEEIVPKTKGE